MDTLSPADVTLCIPNIRGLHARAAAKFVEIAEQYRAEVWVRKVGGDPTEVSARSILGLMMMAAEQGSEICLRAEGDEAREAVKALSELVNGGFGEKE